MEPFGLFQFLQNLLSPPPPAVSETKAPPTPESVKTPPQNAAAPENGEVPSLQNAAARFLENHELRAKRRR